jgi:SAM-dependent methyltransferase
VSDSNRANVWVSAGAYEAYMGRWSRLVAREFLAWLAVPPARRWLDVGCGTGALADTVLAMANPSTVTGIDPSADFIGYARTEIADPRATFEVGDARALPVETATHDAVVAGLSLNFVPEPEVAAEEMARTARPDATVGAYVWDYAGDMQLVRWFWRVAGALDPSALEFDQGHRFPLCRPDPLAALFRAAGLTAVEVRAVDVPTTFRDFDDYWSPHLLGGSSPAPRYTMSLPEDHRAALREKLRETLPIAPDGSIHLIARAWAVRGQKPAAAEGDDGI